MSSLQAMRTRHLTSIIETGVSDHELLSWYALITPTDLKYRKISKHVWKNFNIDKFLDDIRNSDLCCGDIGEPSETELNRRVACFDSVISGLLDKHAPMRDFTVRERGHQPWFDDESRSTRREVQRLERRFRRDKKPESHQT